MIDASDETIAILPGACRYGGGWARPDADHVWSIGEYSDLTFTLDEGLSQEVPWLLRLDVFPATTPQRLRLMLDGVLLLEATLRRPEVFACRLPCVARPRGTVMRLHMEHPDAQRPPPPSRDTRPLALGFRSISLLPLPQVAVPGDRELARCFESLGDNCEFGIIQRALGAEPMGLMRFGSMPRHALLHALETRFEGFPRRDGLYFTFNNEREFILRDRHTGFVMHTDAFYGDCAASTLIEQQVRKIAFLRRVTLESLDHAEPIFVYKQNATPDEAAILPLWMALRRYAPNTLLWVSIATTARQVGTVETILPGLMRGYVERFSPYHAITDFCVRSWRMVLREAWRLRAQDASNSHATRLAAEAEPAE